MNTRTIQQSGFDRFPTASHKEGFVFPPSVQSDLFSYLKPEKQEFIKPILRVFKKHAQEELCCSLMDYLETGDTVPPTDITLGGVYYYCCQHLTPLHHKQPKSIGTILKQVLGKSLNPQP